MYFIVSSSSASASPAPRLYLLLLINPLHSQSCYPVRRRRCRCSLPAFLNDRACPARNFASFVLPRLLCWDRPSPAATCRHEKDQNDTTQWVKLRAVPTMKFCGGLRGSMGPHTSLPAGGAHKLKRSCCPHGASCSAVVSVRSCERPLI